MRNEASKFRESFGFEAECEEDIVLARLLYSPGSLNAYKALYSKMILFLIFKI
jgi:hypothetical protein